MAFHSRLAHATHNELFALILDSLSEVMTEVRLLGLRIPGTARRAVTHHSQVYEAVKAGDADRARAAMDAHMDEASDTLRRAVDHDPEAADDAGPDG
ncbi:hypothetical protein BH23CHL8_BH23CHL8_19720 [soil metagenome]